MCFPSNQEAEFRGWENLKVQIVKQQIGFHLIKIAAQNSLFIQTFTIDFLKCSLPDPQRRLKPTPAPAFCWHKYKGSWYQAFGEQGRQWPPDGEVDEISLWKNFLLVGVSSADPVLAFCPLPSPENCDWENYSLFIPPRQVCIFKN